MKDRIMQIMKTEHMTQQEFAQRLDLSPASLSSIFNGRTNPTNNHVQAIHRCFPNINISWLMFGEGEMYLDASCHPEDPDSAGSDGDTESGMAPMVQQASSPYIYNKVDESVVEQTASSYDGTSQQPPFAKDTVYPEINPATQIVRETIKYIDKPQRKISEIRIFFDDGTYEVFSK